jgi:hypothetical protein
MEFVTARVVIGQNLEETSKRALAQLGNPNTYRRQAHVTRHRNIVETDNGDIVGNAQSGVAEREKRADGHIVVRRKYPVETMSCAEQLRDCSRSRFFFEVTLDDLELETV